MPRTLDDTKLSSVMPMVLNEFLATWWKKRKLSPNGCFLIVVDRTQRPDNLGSSVWGRCRYEEISFKPYILKTIRAMGWSGQVFLWNSQYRVDSASSNSVLPKPPLARPLLRAGWAKAVPSLKARQLR